MTAQLAQRLAAALVAGAVISTAAGCGAKPTVTGVNLEAAMAQAEATSTLMKGFTRIHQGVFAKLDKDSNKFIDEYEAGPNLTLSDFRKADTGRNGKLTFTEFKKYAVTQLFFFRDTPASFTSRFRRDLGAVFSRLDTNRDGVLQKNETSLRDMAKLKLTFEYPRLNIKVKVSKINKEIFGAADKTGDGVLGQAEFEDLYIEMVVAALGGSAPAPAPGPAPDPAPPAPAPDEPAPPAPPAPEDPNAAPGEDPAADPAAPKKAKKKPRSKKEMDENFSEEEWDEIY